MISIIRLITWNGDLSDAARTTAVRALEEAGRTASASLCSAVLPGGWNGGDILWHLLFKDEAALEQWRAMSVSEQALNMLDSDAAHVDWVRIDAEVGGGTRRPDLASGIYRVLFLVHEPDTSDTQRAAYEADMLGLGTHIPEILNWRLSRVTASGGTLPWTYVWEQEFEKVDNIKKEYVEHPYHWGYVDRWYDPEMPGRIIRPTLCHSFVATDQSMLALALSGGSGQE